VKLMTHGGAEITLGVEWYEGTHGTMFGRVNRDALGWPHGPWDNEPDVLISSYEGLHTIVTRELHGTHFRALLIPSKESRFSGMRIDDPIEAENFTGLAGVFNGFQLGSRRQFYDERGISGDLERRLDLDMQCAGGLASGYVNWPEYRDIGQVVSAAGRLVKFLNFPIERNHPQFARLVLSIATMIGKPIKTVLDVEKIGFEHLHFDWPNDRVAANIRDRTRRPQKINVSIMRTWAGGYLVHGYAPDGDPTDGYNLLTSHNEMHEAKNFAENYYGISARPFEEWAVNNYYHAQAPELSIASIEDNLKALEGLL
jgi:hypothetical protein